MANEKRSWTCNVRVSEGVEVGGPNWPFRTYLELLKARLGELASTDTVEGIFVYEYLDIIDLTELDGRALGLVRRANASVISGIVGDSRRFDGDEYVLKLANDVEAAIADDPRQ